MRLTPLGVLSLLLLSTTAHAANVTGTVTGPDGKPFRAAFVQARNAAMKMTVSVLSDNQGRYTVENLPAGDYKLSIRAVTRSPSRGTSVAKGFHLSPKRARNFLFTSVPPRQARSSRRTACPIDLVVIHPPVQYPKARLHHAHGAIGRSRIDTGDVQAVGSLHVRA